MSKTIKKRISKRSMKKTKKSKSMKKRMMKGGMFGFGTTTTSEPEQPLCSTKMCTDGTNNHSFGMLGFGSKCTKCGCKKG